LIIDVDADYENPNDTNADAVYNVRIESDDGG
jgi:hypothetical protein